VSRPSLIRLLPRRDVVHGGTPVASGTPIDFAGIAAQLLFAAESHLKSWFPAGRIKGREFCIGDISGADGESLKVNLDTGRWSDFADANVSGGDLISLYAAIHRISQPEAARRLTGNDAARAEPQFPPDGTEPPTFRHPKHGAATAHWEYHDERGRIVGYVSRHEPLGNKKQILPWRWDGKRWRNLAMIAPRPLYRLSELLRNRQAQVIVVEGEKTADALAAILGDAPVVTTWPGGCKALGKTDLSPLCGRNLILWPDADDPGVEAMHKLAQMLKHHCNTIGIVTPTGQSDGWDAADAAAAGWDRQQIIGWIKERIRRLDEPQPSAAVAEVKDGPVQWWDLGLESNDGKPFMNLDNSCRVLTNHPQLAGRLWYDVFRDRIMSSIFGGADREWSDSDDLWLQRFIQGSVGLHRIGVDCIHGAVDLVARQNPRNEPELWLRGLTWDGEPRLMDLFYKGFGTATDHYHQRTAICFVMGMVARVFRPGCKLDYMPVFEGPQGAYKSQALAVIGGKWFTECHEPVTSKDFYIAIAGNMLVEISELHALTRAEIERVKGIITTATDRYRRPYERRAGDHPRQGVFAGSTNRNDWNRDDTGARRFWPVACGRIDLGWLAANREQLFAEAVARLNADEIYWDFPQSEAASQQDERRPEDPWAAHIADYLDTTIDSIVTTDDILHSMNIPNDRRTRVESMRVGSILRDHGWERVRIRSDGVRRWGYRPGPT